MSERPMEGALGRYGPIAVIWRFMAGWPIRISKAEWESYFTQSGLEPKAEADKQESVSPTSGRRV